MLNQSQLTYTGNVLAISDDIDTAALRDQACDNLDDIRRQLGSFAIKLWWAGLSTSVEPDHERNGQATSRTPWEGQPQRCDYPVVTEGKEPLCAPLRLAAIGRVTRVEVHRCAEDVGAALDAECVVYDQRDVVGEEREKKLKDRFCESVDAPGPVGKKAIVAGVMLLLARITRRLNQARNTVAACAADPSHSQCGIGLEPWLGKARAEDQENILQALRDAGSKHADSLPSSDLVVSKAGWG